MLTEHSQIGYSTYNLVAKPAAKQSAGSGVTIASNITPNPTIAVSINNLRRTIATLRHD
jgi:hypothetical protein